MHDEIRTIHIGEKIWKWELVDGVKFPYIKIKSPYGRVYKEAAESFLNKDEKFISFKISILPSHVQTYIENLLK